MNVINLVHGAATVCHQVHSLYWGHFFFTVLFLLNWYKFSTWKTSHTHSCGWNSLICFPFIRNLGCPAFSQKIYCHLNIWHWGQLWYTHTVLYVCVYQGCSQTLVEICRSMSIHVMVSGQWPPGKIYLHFALLKMWKFITSHIAEIHRSKPPGIARLCGFSLFIASKFQKAHTIIFFFLSHIEGHIKLGQYRGKGT